MKPFVSSRAMLLLMIGAGLLLPAGQALAQTEVIVDNADSGFAILSGSWTLTSATPGYWGTDYRFANTTSAGGAPGEVEFRPDLPESGYYEVSVWYTQGGNRSTAAPFTADGAVGRETVRVNQQVNGSQWVILGVFPFDAGTGGRVRLGNQTTGSVVIADAVRFRRVGELPADPQEFRGMWVSRFEWPNTNLDTVRTTIDTIMTNLANNRFNAVVFQVRGQADTLYPSPYEPWSPILSSNGLAPAGWGSFDPLQYAIDAAHARGLEFHAYINTHVAWQSGTQSPPTYAPSHVFWQHFNAADPNARDWLIHSSPTTPVQWSSDDYVWIAPGVPAAQAYTRKQVMHVVRNYDVDGVHFDRIRTPGTAYSHDPISEARLAGEGNPDGLSFADWTRDQFTRMLRDLYAQIMQVKPHIKVSSAPLGLYRQERYPGYPSYFLYGYSVCYQDAQAWIAAGAMDFLVPQIYWADGGDLPDFSDLLPDWVAYNAGRHIYAGHNQSTGVAALIQDINNCRTMGAQGNVIWSYKTFNNNGYWDDLSDPGKVYELPAIVPDMGWKNYPFEGIILGTVTGLDGVTPVVDARITRSGSSYKALSSYDGIYSFLKVPPGTYTLSASKSGFPTEQIDNVTVVAGQVTHINISLGDGPDITGQPQSQSVCQGTDAHLTVQASGTGTLTYQWRKDGDNLTDGGNISGSTSDALQIAAVDAANVGTYDCVVTDSVGGTLSNPATLSLLSPVTITLHPQSTQLRAGETAIFRVAASGSGTLTYQWQKDDLDLIDGGAISGATTPELTIANVRSINVGAYRCIVTGDCGPVASDAALLSLYGPAGDFDGDTDVDQADFGHIQSCLSGVSVRQDAPNCQDAKLDQDTDVDRDDVALFLGCLSGADVPASVDCTAR